MMPEAITTENLSVLYGNDPALHSVDLSVSCGSSLAVIGPNGSGKSTLLGVLAGTIAPSSGRFDVSGPSPALMLQATDVDKSLPITVRDTVSLGRYPSVGLLRRFKADDRRAVDSALERMNITHLENQQLHNLSGGQRQRVLLAQALAQQSDVLLLDEPVNGLDITSRGIILDVVDEEIAAGRSVVITTHSLDDARRCDQVLLLDTATVAVGKPADVLTDGNLEQVFGLHHHAHH